MSEPKFRKGDIVRVKDPDCVLYGWELKVEVDSVFPNSDHRYYWATVEIWRPTDRHAVALRFHLREDQLDEVHF